MNNKEFRTYAKEHKVKLWQIAEKLGKTDADFSRFLRHERNGLELENLKGLVDEIAREREEAEADD